MELRNIIRHTLIGLTAIALQISLSSSTLYADIYMYIDQNGVVHFTNVLTTSESDYRIYVKERRDDSYGIYTADQYDHFIREASELYSVSYPLLKAIIKAESDFNPRAVSKKGALGLMQLMPENVKAMRISDPFDPWENIMGGARYFRKMLDRFKGKLSLSLAAYNAGPTTVERYNHKIPPYKETENYVERVLRYYYSYKY
jgi:soluble lytic murein transglycosylase-like protein